MSTRTQLRQRVRELMSLPVVDSDSGSPNDTQINNTLEEVRREVWMHIAAIFSQRLDTQTTMTYTASAESVSLPSAVQLRIITSVQAQYSNSSDTKDRYDLIEATIAELLQEALNGEPEYYFIDYVNKLIRVRPIPASAATLTLRYVAGLTALADNTSPDEWPSEFHHVIAYGAAARLLRKLGDASTGDVLQQEYEDIRDSLQRYVSEVFKDTHFHSSFPRRV